jgi:hypothetical protein
MMEARVSSVWRGGQDGIARIVDEDRKQLESPRHSPC